MHLIFLQSRQEGALVIDHLEIGNINSLNSIANDETTAMLAEFKLAINAYLKELVTSPLRSLAEVIAFNNKFSDLVSTLHHLSMQTCLGNCINFGNNSDDTNVSNHTCRKRSKHTARTSFC